MAKAIKKYLIFLWKIQNFEENLIPCSTKVKPVISIQAQLISLEKSTPLIQFEPSLQSPPNPFTEPSRSSQDSSFSALHSTNPGDFNDTPKPGFSTNRRQETPFSWIDSSLPLSTGRVNLKNAFRKSLRKTLRKSKSAKASIRKRSIFTVEVDDKASTEDMSTDGSENAQKVQVQAEIQVKSLEQFRSLLMFLLKVWEHFDTSKQFFLGMTPPLPLLKRLYIKNTVSRHCTVT